jgi:hypothetical protein
MAGKRELTKEEVLYGIKTDLSTAFNFVIDNNYDSLSAQLRVNGFSPDNEDQALENLKFLYEFDRPRLVVILGQVPYENNANNWTAGLDEIFRPESEQPTTRSAEGSNVWGSILGGLGGLLSGVGGSLTGSTNTQLTTAQIEAARVRAAEEKKRKDRNTLIIILIIVASVIGIAIYMSKKGKKKG